MPWPISSPFKRKSSRTLAGRFPNAVVTLRTPSCSARSTKAASCARTSFDRPGTSSSRVISDGLCDSAAPRVIAWTARRCRELGLDAKTLAKSNDVIGEAVAEAPLTRRALAATLENRRLSPDGQRMPYMLMRAELDMIVTSGPLDGKQHTYAAFDSRVPPAREVSRDEALGRLAKRYFASRGPATIKDFSWWSGLPMPDVRRSTEIAGRALKRIDGDGRTYLFADEQPSRKAARPRVDLVQIYDEIAIAYSESRDVLWSDGVKFAVPSNAGGHPHVILREGMLLGNWRAVRARGEVRVEAAIKEKLDAATRTSLDRALERYRRFATS